MDFTDDFDKIIIDFLRSDDENATNLAVRLNDFVQQRLNIDKKSVNVRYCWLFEDGELSGILSKSEVEQFSEAKFREAESLGYKLLELRDFNAGKQLNTSAIDLNIEQITNQIKSLDEQIKALLLIEDRATRKEYLGSMKLSIDILKSWAGMTNETGQTSQHKPDASTNEASVCPSCGSSDYHLGHYKRLMICDHCDYSQKAN